MCARTRRSSSSRRPGRRQQVDVDAHEGLVDDVEAALGQELVDVGHAAVGGVLDRDHAELGAALADRLDRRPRRWGRAGGRGRAAPRGRPGAIGARSLPGRRCAGHGASPPPLCGSGPGAAMPHPVARWRRRGAYTLRTRRCGRKAEAWRATKAWDKTRHVDTMTITKIVGGFCGSLLVFLLVGRLARHLRHAQRGGRLPDRHRRGRRARRRARRSRRQGGLRRRRRGRGRGRVPPLRRLPQGRRHQRRRPAPRRRGGPRGGLGRRLRLLGGARGPRRQLDADRLTTSSPIPGLRARHQDELRGHHATGPRQPDRLSPDRTD